MELICYTGSGWRCEGVCESGIRLTTPKTWNKKILKNLLHESKRLQRHIRVHSTDMIYNTLGQLVNDNLSR